MVLWFFLLLTLGIYLTTYFYSSSSNLGATCCVSNLTPSTGTSLWPLPLGLPNSQILIL
jgi:hypothetical protein